LAVKSHTFAHQTGAEKKKIVSRETQLRGTFQAYKCLMSLD